MLRNRNDFCFFNVSVSGMRDVSRRYDCSVLSCASKAPRTVIRFLASPAQPSQACGRASKRIRIQPRSGRHNLGGLCLYEASDFVLPQKLLSSCVLHLASRNWKLHCSLSSSSQCYDEVSPESLWEDLKPTISYLLTKELELVYDALNLAFKAHDGQKRRSGEPFIFHLVAVAQILGELELDWESIAAGLLHDTVEDTNVVTFDRIEKDFGSTVWYIVEGETKVSKLGKLKSKDYNYSVQDVKADDLRQMFLAMTEEVRVIIVKLADRLHNMRTLSHMAPHKQSIIAMETLQVFAPLAKLLGIYQIKSELENLAFMYTSAQDYAKIKRRVADLYKAREKELNEANKILMKRIKVDQFLDLMTVRTEIQSVCKEPYSMYKTVLKSKNHINEVNHIAQPCAGVGALCSAQKICYHVLGLVHGIWTPIPQAIRTEEMDLIAGRGIAAHYSGKVFVNGLVGHVLATGRSSQGKIVCLNNANVALRIGWLNTIREWQEEFVGNMSSREFVGYHHWGSFRQ